MSTFPEGHTAFNAAFAASKLYQVSSSPVFVETRHKRTLQDEICEYIGAIPNTVEMRIQAFASEKVRMFMYLQDAQVLSAQPLTTNYVQTQLGMKSMFALHNTYNDRMEVPLPHFTTKRYKRAVYFAKDHIYLEYEDTEKKESAKMWWMEPEEKKFGRFFFHYVNSRESQADQNGARGEMQLWYDEYPQGYQLLINLDGQPFFENENDAGAFFDNDLYGGSFDHAGKPVRSVRF
jgi:hypothetical protein